MKITKDNITKTTGKFKPKAILVSESQFNKLANSRVTQEALLKFKQVLPEINAQVTESAPDVEVATEAETTSGLVNMSDDEKKHWFDLSHKMKLYSQYVVACRYHKYRVSRELARNLKECGVRIPFRQRYFMLDIFNFASRVKNKIKRVINNKVRV